MGLGRGAWGLGRKTRLGSGPVPTHGEHRPSTKRSAKFSAKLSAKPWARSLLVAGLALLGFTANAAIKVEIPEVSDPIANNIREFLSLTRYADRKDLTAETMSRLQRRIVTETHQALQPLGYYEPTVDYQVRQDGADWLVTINVQPGRPVRLSEVAIDITGPGAPLGTLRDLLKQDSLKPGLRLNHGSYERIKGELIRTARNEGFLDAELTRSELTIDRAARRANVALVMETGDRYRYGQIDISQDVINEEPMRRLLRMQPGDPYTLDSLLRTQYVLDDSQYFSTVDIESGDPDQATHTVPVTIAAGPRRRHRYGASLGYGTDTAVRGRFSWENRRVNREGHRFRAELLGSSVIQQLTGRYSIPVFDVALEKLEFAATLRDEERAELTSKLAEVGVGLTQAIGSWQRVVSIRLSNETTIEAAQAGAQTPGKVERTDLYVYPSLSYSTLPSYIVGRQSRPYYFFAELRGSPETLGSDASFVQLRLQGERVFDFWTRWHLRLRTDLAASWVADSSILPASQRFFAGGERSVRGFGLNELSPLTDGKKVGGKHLAVGSIELERDLPRNFGAAVFYDIGNAFNDVDEPMHYAVGVGARYHIAVASFGVDVAQPLSDSGSPRVHLYISTEF